MKMNEFIGVCLGFGNLDTTFDKYCDAFDIDFSDDDVYEAIRCCRDPRNVGSFLYHDLFERIIDKYDDQLDWEMFDYDINGAWSRLYYNGVGVYSPHDLEEIIAEQQEL